MNSRSITFVTGVLTALSAVAIFGIMSVSFGDVAARYVARPLGGAYEITEMLVGLMVFAALPLVTYQGKHVTVSFLHPLMQRIPVLGMVVQIFARFVILALCLFLAWHLWQLGNQFASRNAKAIFAGIPMAPFAYFASVMCLLSAIAAVIRPNTAPAGEEI